MRCLIEHGEPKDASKRTRCFNGTHFGRAGGGCQRDGRESVDEIGRVCCVGDSKFSASGGHCRLYTRLGQYLSPSYLYGKNGRNTQLVPTSSV